MKQPDTTTPTIHTWLRRILRRLNEPNAERYAPFLALRTLGRVSIAGKNEARTPAHGCFEAPQEPVNLPAGQGKRPESTSSP